jgi:hypothetical protein
MRGVPLKEVSIARDWFSAPATDPSSYEKERPPSTVMGIHRADDGKLLVLLQRARQDWQPDSRGSQSFSFSYWLEYVEQLVEVLDTATMTLLGYASTPQDVYFTEFLRDGRLLGFRTDTFGRHTPALARVRAGPEKGG